MSGTMKYIISLVFLLFVRDGIESKYPPIVFVSIFIYGKFCNSKWIVTILKCPHKGLIILENGLVILLLVFSRWFHYLHLLFVFLSQSYDKTVVCQMFSKGCWPDD